MRVKGFPLFIVLGMLVSGAGCDNMTFEGVEVELRAPAPPPGDTLESVEADTEELEPALEPLELGPVLYVVQRVGESRASFLPVAELRPDGYHPLPDPAETPDLVERFALGRWDAGMEFTLLARGVRVGTLVSEGGAQPDESTCMLRPRGVGHLELRPEAEEHEWFLALARDSEADAPSTATVPDLAGDAELGEASLNVAQRVIPAMDVPWPSSIPEIRYDLQAFTLDPEGRAAFAASFVFGDELDIGQPTPLAYSLFILAEAGPDRYEPFFAWYHRLGEQGKAAPRLLAAHDARRAGSSDAVLEVFGEETRWLAIAGADEGDWGILYQDECGVPAGQGAIRTFP